MMGALAMQIAILDAHRDTLQAALDGDGDAVASASSRLVEAVNELAMVALVAGVSA